jgi:hypothetical protein
MPTMLRMVPGGARRPTLHLSFPPGTMRSVVGVGTRLTGPASLRRANRSGRTASGARAGCGCWPAPLRFSNCLLLSAPLIRFRQPTVPLARWVGWAGTLTTGCGRGAGRGSPAASPRARVPVSRCCGAGSGRGIFRRLAAGPFGPRALPTAGLFLVARRVLGLLFTPSMIADSGRVFNSGNRASLRAEGDWQPAALAPREGPLYWGRRGLASHRLDRDLRPSTPFARPPFSGHRNANCQN